MSGSKIEIERKFLLEAPPDGLEPARGEAIEQGYLARVPDGPEVRLRRRAGRATLTVKGAGGLARSETEVTLAPEQFDALWPATAGARLTKTRYRWPVPGSEALTADLDVYDGAHAGLVVAEVEFDDETASRRFTPPVMFGREVTEDPRYKNRNLVG